MFHDEFFPVAVRKKFTDEFDKLRQWQMTIDQYVSRFYQLVKHAPGLVNTE